VRIRESVQKRSPLPSEERESNQSNSGFEFDNAGRLPSGELNLNILTNAYEFILPFCQSAVAPATLRGDGGRQRSEAQWFLPGSFLAECRGCSLPSLDQRFEPELLVHLCRVSEQTERSS